VEALEILENVEGVSVVRFKDVDVVRHPMVARIVDAYEKAASMQELGALPGNLTKPVTRNVRKKA
jgi:phosphate starvation-inducible PhoH-like protein